MTDLAPLSPDLPDAAAALAEFLREAGFTADGIAAHLGPEATEALYRRAPGVVLDACGDDSQLSALIRFFLLRRPATAEQLADMLAPRLALLLIDASLVLPIDDRAEYRPAFDIRPHVVAGEPRFVVSDPDASVTDHVPGRDHVLGVGAASLSLLSAAPLTPVESVLDLGTGSGVQALAQSNSAERVVATDIHRRALDLAAATFAANGVENVELRQGAWFEPVEGQRFDRVVANPPFVVGPPEVGHVYRDSGLALDGATELVVRTTPEHLAAGGSAFILGSWAHVLDQSWQSRFASWLPETGVSAWVLQRDVVDPGMYVSTWLKDESIDPRSEDGVSRTLHWLDHFREHDVHAIGFGWIFLRDIGDAPSEVTAEELTQPFSDPLGPEAEEHFARAQWLRGKGVEDILDARYLVRPGVAVEEVSVADTEVGMGFEPKVTRVSRTDGPRFTHDIDAGTLALLSGVHPQGLPLRDVVGLLAVSRGLESAEELAELESASVPLVVDLVRHGILLPAEIAEVGQIS